jgi:hypothetical protein
MPEVRFEPTIPVFERAKTVHVVDRAATVTGTLPFTREYYLLMRITGCNNGSRGSLL